MLLRSSAQRKLALSFIGPLFLFTFLGFRVVSQQPTHGPRYKPQRTDKYPVEENFPWVQVFPTASSLPPIPSFNQQWQTIEAEPAPLMIGFTRNWLILQQCVVSYLTAGWPASSIYVIDNTGTLDSNRAGKLSLQNPFYLDYQRLTRVYGINVLTTPSLQTFTQLQNYMMYTALERGWDTYFWSHMDVAVLSDETYTITNEFDVRTQRYSNLYDRAVRKRNELRSREKTDDHKWAAHWFAYDQLTLVNLDAYMKVGGWDPMIDYYHSDCDFHERLFMAGYTVDESAIGLVANIATTIPDLAVFYRRIGWEPTSSVTASKFGLEAERGDQSYHELRDALADLARRKAADTPRGANSWQRAQQGGQGEPFYRDADGFDAGLWWHVELGRKIFAEKRGTRDCNLRGQGLKADDAWRVKHNGWWKVTVS